MTSEFRLFTLRENRLIVLTSTRYFRLERVY
jgi:hypothetical protein